MISATCPTAATASVQLTTTASDPDGDTLLYSYTVTGGRVTGEGANVSWDLSGLGPGTYTASVDVDDGCGCITSSTTTVTVAACTDCKPKLVCPTVNVTCPSEVDEGGSITFTTNFTQGTPEVTPTYNWTVSAGTITSGQGTSSIMVGTNGLGGSAMDIGYRGGIFKGCRGANNVASSTLGTSSAGLGMAYLLNVGLAGNSAIIEDCIVQPEGGGSTPKLANIWGASGGDKVYLNRVGTTASAIDNPGGATVVNTTP